MVELVIKIPEDSYKATCNGCMLPPDVENVVQGIKNGTPIQRGHGRLIDGSKLKVELECGIRAGNYEEGYEKYPHINSMDDCVDAVEYADTIIEADAPKRRKGTPLEENDSGYNCENWIP